MSEFGRDKQYWADRLNSVKTDIEQMLCLSKIEAFELNEEIAQLRQVAADRTKEAELSKRAANEMASSFAKLSKAATDAAESLGFLSHHMRGRMAEGALLDMAKKADAVISLIKSTQGIKP